MKYETEKLNQLSNYEELQITTNDSIYRKCQKNQYAGCAYCAWNRGCNRRYKLKLAKHNNWKLYRKTQYKNK